MRFIKTCISKPLFWIIALALLTRLPAVWQGLPAVFNSTEYFVAKTALGMAARVSIDPLTYIYPAGWYFVEIVVFGALYLGGLIFGWVANSAQFAVRFLIDPTLFYISARFVALALSLFAVCLLYRIVKKRHKPTTAVLVAIAVAADHFVQIYAASATAESLLFLFSTLSVFFLLEAAGDGTKRAMTFAAVFAGLAIGTKYNAGFFGPGILLAAWLSEAQTGKRLKATASSLAFIFAGFLIINPGWLINPAHWLDGFLLVREQMVYAVSLERGVNYFWELGQILRYASLPVLAGIGYALWLLIFDRKKKDWPLHLIWVCTFLYVGSWQKKGIDYLLPVFPVWFVFFSDGLSRLKKSRLNKIVVAFMLLPAVLYAFYSAFLNLQADTRQLASEWILKHVKPAETICYDNYHYDLSVFDIRRYTEYGAGAKNLPPAVKQELSDFMTHPRQRAMVGAWTDSTASTTVGFVEQNRGRHHKSLLELRNDGVVYLINNVTNNRMYTSADAQRYPPEIRSQIKSARRFFEDLRRKQHPLVVFESDWNTPGPRIEIYSFQKSDRQ